MDQELDHERLGQQVHHDVIGPDHVVRPHPEVLAQRVLTATLGAPDEDRAVPEITKALLVE